MSPPDEKSANTQAPGKLSTAAGTYTALHLPAAQDAAGAYYPDAVVGPFAAAARAALPRSFAQHAAGPEFAIFNGQPILEPALSPADSKALVIAALDEFDPRLGARARQ